MLQRSRTSCSKPEQVGGHEGLAVPSAEVLRCLFGTQRPGDVTAVVFLVIRCIKRDVALSLVAKRPRGLTRDIP